MNVFLSFFQLMKLMAVRRVQMANTGKSDVPLPPAPPPHPGYAPNAAIHAIKRHAMEFVNPKAVAVRFFLLSRKADLSRPIVYFMLFFSFFRWATKKKVLSPKAYVSLQVLY